MAVFRISSMQSRLVCFLFVCFVLMFHVNLVYISVITKYIELTMHAFLTAFNESSTRGTSSCTTIRPFCYISIIINDTDGTNEPKFDLFVLKLKINNHGSDFYIQFCFRGRPFDSEGAWHFLEINILTLKMLEIINLSSSGKKINNLTLTC